MFNNNRSLLFFKQNYMLKPRTLTSKMAEGITRLKKISCGSIESTLDYKATLHLKNSLLKKTIFKTLGIINARDG